MAPEDLQVLQALCTSISAGLSLQSELRRPITRAQVATGPDSGRPTGFYLAWEIADEWELVAIGTLAGAQRRGIGGALLRHLIAYARTSGALRITLEVSAGNSAALQLYRRAGFTHFNTRKAYYRPKNGEPSSDAWELELILSPQATGQ